MNLFHNQLVDIPSFASKELCSLCAEEIMHYVPDYFLGEKINAACLKCKNDEEESNPLSSFPIDGLPSSLVLHWILPHYEAFTSISYNSTFRSHYVRLPNPENNKNEITFLEAIVSKIHLCTHLKSLALLSHQIPSDLI